MHVLDVVSDTFARQANLVTGIEARTKLAFTVTGLTINLLSRSVYAPIGLALFSLITLLLMRVPARLLLMRLVMPLVMAAVVLVTQTLFYGETPLFAIPFPGFPLVGYREGFARGLLITCRVLGGVSLVLLLSLSTPADRLFAAAAWFRMPETFIEIALLVYRYIFVLGEELVTMKDAQRVRLGYRNWRQSMRSLSMLVTCLILRAYDRAGRVFEAMLARGYAGAAPGYVQAFSSKDGIVAVCLGLVLAGFYMLGRIGT